MSRYLGIGSCGSAAALLRHGGHDLGDMEIEDAFNYGMALWGQTGEVAAAPFHRFLEMDEEREERESTPGQTQRVVLAYWATGHPAAASEYLEDACGGFPFDGMEDWTSPFWNFSYWRYRRVPNSEFLKDLDEIEALINGDTSSKPRFMTAAGSSSE